MIRFAALAPDKTPKRVVDRLHSDIAAVLNMPEVSDRITAMGFEVGGTKSQQTTSFIADEIARWGKVIKEGGINGERRGIPKG